MPYVPSKKTDGKSTDREIIDVAVDELATWIASTIVKNSDLRGMYQFVFVNVAVCLRRMLLNPENANAGGGVGDLEWNFAKAIYDTGAKYGYEGAYLGEFNYAFTRFIQRVSQIKVAKGDWKDELRYWLYADTVAALMYAANHTEDFDIGVNGVFMDIKDEYKRRVNTAYEAAQIVKSGDCYDGPYYTRLVEIVDESGTLIGHQEVMLKRSEDTLHKDVLDYQIILRKKQGSN